MRSVDEIYDEMLLEKSNYPELNNLSSTSKTAVYRLFLKVFAAAAATLESLWEAKKIELDQLAQRAIPGTAQWYVAEMLKFQYNYSLVVRDGRLVYLTDDPTSRIITKAAAITQAGVLIMKVAKANGAALQPLSTAEAIAADSYLREIKFAGTNHLLVNESADLLRMSGTVIYYDGKLDLTQFKLQVEAAITSYLLNLDFNGLFSVNLLRDAIEAVPGCVRGPDLGQIYVRPASGGYTLITRDVVPFAGYIEVDSAFPLNNPSTIQYISV